MNWSNQITQLLNIRYPFIQAPMLTVTTSEMVAAISNLGGLGSLPLGYSSEQNALEKIREVKKLTSKPFSVNLFAYDQPVLIPDFIPESLKSFYTKYNVPFVDTIPSKDPYTTYKDLIKIIISEKVPVVSFHFGLPDEEQINLLHQNNIVIMATATCSKEAELIAKRKIDIIIAQGIEAGGNRGTFLENIEGQIGLMSLIASIASSTQLPIVAAGGLGKPQQVAAAFNMGAKAVQLGSFFLRSNESAASPSYKNAIKNSTDDSTVLTRAWSGRVGRCIKNDFTDQITEQDIYPSPIQNFLTRQLRDFGKKIDDPEIQSLWAGQSAQFAEEGAADNLLLQLITETEKILDKA